MTDPRYEWHCIMHVKKSQDRSGRVKTVMAELLILDLQIGAIVREDCVCVRMECAARARAYIAGLYRAFDLDKRSFVCLAPEEAAHVH